MEKPSQAPGDDGLTDLALAAFTFIQRDTGTFRGWADVRLRIPRITICGIGIHSDGEPNGWTWALPPRIAQLGPCETILRTAEGHIRRKKVVRFDDVEDFRRWSETITRLVLAEHGHHFPTGARVSPEPRSKGRAMEARR